MQLLPLRTCLVAAALGVASLFVSLPAQAGDSYSYDELGNVKQISNEQGTRTYTYDEINRLKTEVGVSGARTHSYDANSNRTSDGAPSPTSATFSANSNRLATINGSAVILDANGNVTNDGVYTYTWNDAGQLSILRAVGNPISAYYYYDYRNRRTRKVTTAVAPQGVQTVVYHYDQSDHLIGESLLNATPLRTYVWLGDTPTAVIEHAAVSNPPRTLYLQVDHLGSPRRAKDAAGVVQWSWDSDGYGRTAANEDPDGDGKKTIINLRFPGQYYDQESGLHYNWNRYYSPRLGRYISSDPIGLEGGINTYAYVGGNPLSRIDPLGLAEIPNPNGVVPGGPWTLDPSQPPGVFKGPKTPGKPQDTCRYVPKDATGTQGDPYWKTNEGGKRGWQRYRMGGEPMTPEEAHPGNRPAPAPEPLPPAAPVPWWVRLGVGAAAMSYSKPAY